MIVAIMLQKAALQEAVFLVLVWALQKQISARKGGDLQEQQCSHGCGNPSNEF